jgi:hypothetical protein
MAAATAANGYLWSPPGTQPFWRETDPVPPPQVWSLYPRVRGLALAGQCFQNPPSGPGWGIPRARVFRSPPSVSSAMKRDTS